MEKGWTEVFITTHEYKASMAKDLIENESINVVVINQYDSAYQIFGEFSVHVAENDVEKALQLLKNLKN
jgi:predicted Fe-Mo cluster-binding NifX family protein